MHSRSHFGHFRLVGRAVETYAGLVKSKLKAAALLCLLLFLAGWLFFPRELFQRSSPPAAGTITPSRHAEPALTDAEVTQKFLALEAERERLDQTVWANELLAQRHEQVFIELWDRLRREENAFQVLQDFSFGELRLGTFGPIERTAHDMRRASFGPPSRRLAGLEWREALGSWQQLGYRLSQSEWRHERFHPGTNGTSQSVFYVSLHLMNPNLEDRAILRGRLSVEWDAASAPDAPPFPRVIDATQMELLARRGETPFEWALGREIKPGLNPVFIDPLILYDLNRDGLSEIVLGCRNRVYWNLGNRQFRTAQISAHATNAINTCLIADFTGDGTADFLAADAFGLLLFCGDEQGQFVEPPRRARFTEEALPNPFVMTAGDVDGDHDLDVWLAQYKIPYHEGQMPTPYYDANDGFPSFLLLNDGEGNFRDATAAAGLAPKRFRRTYSSSLVDLDDDKYLDLVVVSDFAGADLYLNDGQGRFRDVTEEWLKEPHAFGMAHTFGDYDLDGRLDWLMIGMNSYVAERLEHLGLGRAEFPLHQQKRPEMAYGNRLYFGRKARFDQNDLSDQVARTGWSWGAVSFDFDNDADEDLYIVNGHKSRATAQDYETQFWRHDIYAAASRHDPAQDLAFRSVAAKLYGAGYSYGGYDKNRFFANQSGKSFLESGFLLGLAMEKDCRNVVSDDLDGDGQLDLVLTTFEEWPEPKQELHIFRNRLFDSGHWIGFRLREGGAGFSPVGAKVFLHLADGRRVVRYLVTGDSYRSQHASTAHFGLGAISEVASAEIRWPNGKGLTLEKPALNRYHRVTPPNGAAP